MPLWTYFVFTLLTFTASGFPLASADDEDVSSRLISVCIDWSKTEHDLETLLEDN